MKDNMFQPSCGHRQVSQTEIQSHMRITHLYGIRFHFMIFYLLALRDAFSKVQLNSIYSLITVLFHDAFSH